MDEADQEMEIVSDPFLDAGIDIPEELPYVQQTIHKRQKSLRKKLSFMTKALARSRDDLNSDNVSIAESLASEISQNSTIIEMKQKPSRINESGDKVYCESMNAMRTNESKPSIKYLDNIDSKLAFSTPEKSVVTFDVSAVISED